MLRAATAACVAASVLAGAPVRANQASAALRTRALGEIYNLDRDAALNSYRQAVAADPEDAAAYRGLSTALWLSITFRRGNMTVDDYLGSVSRQNVKLPPPPADIAAEFNTNLERALAISRKRLRSNPHDVDAEYEVGAAMGLRASYMATVEGSMLGAFRAARQAYDQHEDVLAANPARKDAGLIVGTYRYLVASLALPLRVVAYVVGFGGGKMTGLKMIEAAAGYPGDNQTDARVALVLLYNREQQYDDALKRLEQLREQYPRNRLFWLEAGATSLRAGRPADAERFLSEGIRRFTGDSRQRMFGEEGLWYYKRGAARAAIGRSADAQADLRKSISSEGRDWVHGRAHLEIAKLTIKAGNKQAAAADLAAAAMLCERDADPDAAAEARRLMP